MAFDLEEETQLHEARSLLSSVSFLPLRVKSLKIFKFMRSLEIGSRRFVCMPFSRVFCPGFLIRDWTEGYLFLEERDY